MNRPVEAINTLNNLPVILLVNTHKSCAHGWRNEPYCRRVYLIILWCNEIPQYQ